MPSDNGQDPRAAREYVRAVERALDVVLAFDGEHQTMSLGEVAAQTELPRGTAQRYLYTLEVLGYVQADGPRFRLGPRVLDLAAAYLESTTRWGVAETYVEQLTEELDESSSITVLDGLDILYVVRRPRRRFISLALEVGTRMPAWITSMGRVLLAALPVEEQRAALEASHREKLTSKTKTEVPELLEVLRSVAEKGYCIQDQEIEVGLRSVAVPLHDGDGQVTAGLNVTTQVTRTSLAQIRRKVVPALHRTAGQIDDAWRRRSDVGARDLPIRRPPAEQGRRRW